MILGILQNLQKAEESGLVVTSPGTTKPRDDHKYLTTM